MAASSRARLSSRLALPLALLLLQLAAAALAADTATVLVTTTLDCAQATPAVTQVLQDMKGPAANSNTLGLTVASASCTPANYGLTTVIAIVSNAGLQSGAATLSYAVRTINFGTLCISGGGCAAVVAAGGRVTDARVPTTTLGVIPAVANVTVWVAPLAFKAMGMFQGSVSGAGTTYWNEDQIHATHPEVPLTHQRGTIISNGARFTYTPSLFFITRSDSFVYWEENTASDGSNILMSPPATVAIRVQSCAFLVFFCRNA